MKISCILMATGRVAKINQAVASFMAQSYDGERELLIVNTCTRQTLVCDKPHVRVYNLKQQMNLLKAKNLAIDNCRGDVIVSWSEMDYHLPGFLSQVESLMDDNSWIMLDREFVVKAGNIVSVEPSGENCFVFKRAAWQKMGGYNANSNGASDQNFVGRMTAKEKGCIKNMEPEFIQFVRIGDRQERERVKPTIQSGQIRLNPSSERDWRSFVLSKIGTKRSSDVCVVELGRYGDIINIMPFLKLIADNYRAPHLCVSAEFADLLEGVSYVVPHVVQLKNEELGLALASVRGQYPVVINAQIWGRGWQQKRECESYNKESFRNCGILDKFDTKDFRPVFDKRDEKREAELYAKVTGGSTKALMLVNVSKGVSSPCEHCKSLLDIIRSRFGDKYNVVDLSEIRAHRLYDMLVLLERAACLVCIDTSFLHLAACVSIPVVAITNPKDWAGTIVRCGNLAAQLTYEDVLEDANKIIPAVESALRLSRMPASKPISSIPVSRRIFHCVERHEERNPETLARKIECWNSWDTLYESGELIPAHYWNYTRTADKTIGDSRDLPYLKDCLMFAMEQADYEDIIMWTNDDNVLHPDVATYIRFHVSVYGPVTSFRSEFGAKIPPLSLPAHEFDQGSTKHMGRDIFAAKKSWLVENWDSIPDFILGASDFDLCLAAMIRNQYGIPTSNRDIAELKFPAEAMRGYVAHRFHHSHWSRPDYQNTAPAQLHNRKIFREWAEKHCRTLIFNDNGTLK